MNVEIICVGTELLLGDILNTNAKFLSERMAEMGFNLFSQSVVGDNALRLEKQIALSLARSEIVILSGGLGPTNDDITKETVAKALNLQLEPHAESLKQIEQYFARVGRVMSENNKKQALTIKGATVLQNDHGTAPRYVVKTKNGAVILLPAPPKELVPMFNEKVVPLLKPFSNSTIISHNVRLFGVGESVAAEYCGDLLDSKNPTVATYAKTGEVDIRVTASAPTERKANELCQPVIAELKNIFGSHIYGIDTENLQNKVVELLKSENMKLATAESCTAGMLSGKITEVPGSSEVFEMGVTAYANHIKVHALGVDADLIDKKGAVCAEVAAQMATGIRTMCNANIGVGITGVAGPGQSEGKPAGLVYIAVADSEKVYVRKIMGRGDDRETTRTLATNTALDMVRRYIEGAEDLISYGTVIGAPINLMEGYQKPNKRVAVKADPKTTRPASTEPPIIFSDEEILKMFNTTDEDLPELRPEKLEIEDNSVEFIFEDEGYSSAPDYSVRSDNAFAEIDDMPLEISDDEYYEPAKAKKRSFFASLFPWKGDPAGEKVRKTIFLVAFLVLIGTMVYLVNYFVEGWLQQSQISSAAEVWEDDDSMRKNSDGIFIGFESLLEQNSDVKAWIKINGTAVNNPVYQCKDNDFYLDHDMNKQSSRYGALFIDKDAKFDKSGGYHPSTKNIVVYGHHMKDGTMFGSLEHYTDLSYYKNHPIIDFTTLYRDGDYKIFAVFITNDLPEHDNGQRFNYMQSSFGNDEQFLAFVDEVKKRSIIDTGVDVVATDELLTLSTCTYEFDDARLVVMARRIRDGETDTYNTSTAKVNPRPLYPQIWYDKRGGKKPNLSSTNGVSSNLQSNEQVTSDVASDVSSGVSSDVSSLQAGTTTSTQSGTTTSTPQSTVTSTPPVTSYYPPEVSSAPKDPVQTSTPDVPSGPDMTGPVNSDTVTQ